MHRSTFFVFSTTTATMIDQDEGAEEQVKTKTTKERSKISSVSHLYYYSKTWRTNHRMKQNNQRPHRPLKRTPHSPPPSPRTFRLTSSSHISSPPTEKSNDLNILSHGGHASFLFTSLTIKIVLNYVSYAVSIVIH